MEIAEFDEKIRQLSQEEQAELMNYIDNILSSKKSGSSYRPSFDWAGGLSFLKPQYTSVELQKKSIEWLAGDI